MRRRFRQGLTGVLVVCASHAPARTHAQEALGPQRNRALTQYGIDRWDDRAGLPQNSVQAIAQTSDGYLWLGTQEGLLRFDGVRFRTYDETSTPALRKPYIWALEADGDGSLWIGTEEGGLTHFKDGRFRSIGVEDGLPAKWVNAIKRDRDGNLWVGTIGGGLARIRGGRIERFDSARGLPAKMILSIAVDAAGIVWVATPAGLARIEDDRVRLLTVADGLPGTPTLQVLPSDSGLWIGTSKGLARLQGDRITTYGKAQGLPHNVVTDLAEDRDGHLWIATPAGLARMSGGQIELMPKGDTLAAGASVGSLLVDREGSLWFGMSGAGLARLRETPFLPVGAPEGLPPGMAFPILQDRTGAIWIGMEKGEVVRLLGDDIRVLDAEDGLSGAVMSLEEGREGMWIGTLAGLFQLRGEEVQPYTLLSPGPTAQARAVVEDRAGRLWVGTANGLQRLRPGEPKLYTKAHGLPDNFIVTLFEARDGALWVGMRSALSRIENGRITSYTPAHGLMDGTVTSLHEDVEGTLWIGSSAGLGRFRSGRFTIITPDRGLCDRSVHRVLEDDRGNLWLSGNKGIMRLPKADVAAVASGRRSRVRCELFGRAEGMRSRETNGAVNPAGWRARDGRLWFPTIAGVVVVDPRDASLRLTPPQVAIEDLVVDGRSYDALPDRLPAGTRTLEINFTGLSFVAPEKMRFRYKLEGLSGDWIDAGNRRTAYFTNLPPGRYRFRVAAANAAGEWSRADASVAFGVLAAPHETWWFRMLALAALAAAAVALYRWRMRRLRERAQALLELAEARGRAEAEFRDLFENASDAIFTSDGSGNVTAMNRLAEELTGYSRAEASTLHLRDLLPAGQAGDQALRAWLSSSARTLVTELRTRDDEQIPVEVKTRVIARSNGQGGGVFAAARDVRERTQLERQLRQAQKMEAVGQLAGGVAHDFNNLLTVIAGNTELLLAEARADDESREDLRQIASAAERAAALTRQLLTFSRRQATQPRLLDLNAVIHDLEPLLRRMIGEDVSIVVRPSSEPAQIRADPVQIEQVLVNLAVNARDAMPAGGTLAMRVSVMTVEDAPPVPVRAESGRCVLLEVSDTGTGMDPETQNRIFEPFFTTKEPGRGTGLGLSTVYGIVQQAEGAIVCHSAVGRGTTFRVYLPFALESGDETAETQAERSAPRGTETILLVEDEDSVRKLACRVLRRLGYRVVDTGHGGDALQVVQTLEEPVHLLLTDIVMPGMSGRQLAERVASLRPGVRVLFVSGYAREDLERHGLNGVPVLQKPFTVGELARAVREALDK